MTTPSASDLNLYDGTPFDQTDWDGNWNQNITWLTSGNYDMTFQTVTASSFVGLPTETFALTAGEDISAGNVVRISAGQARKATNASEEGITSVVGIATQTVTSGSSVNIAYKNYESFSGLTLGAIYYVGVDGAITSTAPEIRTVQIGTAVSASRINLNIKSLVDTHSLNYVRYWDRKEFSLGINAKTIESTYTNIYVQEEQVSRHWNNNLGIQNNVSLWLTFTGGASNPSTMQAKIQRYSGSWVDVFESNTFAISNPGTSEYNTRAFSLHTGNITNWDLYTTPATGLNSNSNDWRLQLLGSGNTPKLNSFAFQWDKS